MTGYYYCSEHSQAVGEQLPGTAPQVNTWLLLEFTGRWEREVLDSPGLHPAVRDRLLVLKTVLPRARVSFIRQPLRPARDHIAFFVAVIRESRPVLYRFALEDYVDLLGLDVSAVVSSEAVYDGYRQAEPLFAVCTHGRRDRCCAHFGMPVYDRLTADHAGGAQVWQVSHVSGHRLAANLLALPDGTFYGRVSPDRAVALVAAHRAGRLMLDCYRGRACHPGPVQAAESLLRAETGLDTLDAFRLVGAEQSKSGQWLVRFAGGDGRLHRVTLVAEPSAFRTYLNSTDTEAVQVTQYRLTGHTT
jgi:hypothetical protein